MCSAGRPPAGFADDSALDVVFIDINLPPETSLNQLIESEHLRFPVCDGSLDKVLG